jgi:hypothetical protein
MNLINCRICNSETVFTHTALNLGKYLARYHKCTFCDYWFVVNPHWLPEAYTRAISELDTGILERNLRVSHTLEHLLPNIEPNGNFVDWAGGLGILTRLMRDKGFNYFWQDEYAKNELSPGFEWNICQKIQVVSAIEVMEHVEDPLVFVKDVMRQTKANTLIFSQELHKNILDISWWYFAPETGQHISFYSKRTLNVLATKLELNLFTFDNIYILTKKRIHISIVAQIKYLISKFLYKSLRLMNNRETLSQKDKQFLINKNF